MSELVDVQHGFGFRRATVVKRTESSCTVHYDDETEETLPCASVFTFTAETGHVFQVHDDVEASSDGKLFCPSTIIQIYSGRLFHVHFKDQPWFKERIVESSHIRHPPSRSPVNCEHRVHRLPMPPPRSVLATLESSAREFGCELIMDDEVTLRVVGVPPAHAQIDPIIRHIISGLENLSTVGSDTIRMRFLNGDTSAVAGVITELIDIDGADPYVVAGPYDKNLTDVRRKSGVIDIYVDDNAFFVTGTPAAIALARKMLKLIARYQVDERDLSRELQSLRAEAGRLSHRPAPPPVPILKREGEGDWRDAREKAVDRAEGGVETQTLRDDEWPSVQSAALQKRKDERRVQVGGR
jgi:hypothetical protein